MREKLTTAALIVALAFIAYDRTALHQRTVRADAGTIRVYSPEMRSITSFGSEAADPLIRPKGDVVGFSCVPVGTGNATRCFILTSEK
jgi:hypothetical protein